MMDKSEKRLRVGITGHRKLTRQQAAAVEPLIKRTIDNIIFYHQNTFGDTFEKIFTSSLAEGADSLFAHIAIERFDCVLRIILPFEKEEYIKDFETEQLKNEFEFLLHHEKVSEIECLQNLDSGNRAELYFQAGKKIVDDNDYIIAVWNEEKPNGSGGTGDIAAYAIGLGKNLLVINPFSEVPEIKGSYLPEFAKAPYNQFTREGDNSNLLKNFFTAYDNAAVSNQGSFERIRENCFNIGLIAAFLFSAEFAFSKLSANIGLHPAIQLTLILAGLSCIIIIPLLASGEKRHSFHEKYLSNRYIAERLRVDELFFKCGFYPSKSESEIVYTYVADFKSLSPLLVINKFIQLCSYLNSSVGEKQMIAENLIKEQSNYHCGRVKKLSKFIRRNSLMTKILSISFIMMLLFVVLSSIYALQNGTNNLSSSGFRFNELFFSILLFLFLFIPALLVKLTAKKYFGEWQKLISQSEYMISYLEEMSLKVNAAEEDKQLQHVLNTLNENIYIENLEWEMFMLNKNEMTIYKNRKLEHARRTEIMNEKFAREVLNTRLEIQQQTMQHIGREIHDNVGQKLVLASLYMQQLDAENKNSSAQKKINSIAAIINESLADLRSLSRNLTETVNPHTSLYELIDHECKKINAAGSCKVTFESDIKQIDLSQAVKNFALRILQEFLQNSLKHAACTQINVSLQSEEGGLTVSSFDNGKGFTVNGKMYAGIGLKNIRKRAEIIGADLLIDSKPGDGTKMRLFIPSHKLNA